jgi:hypothetical protein
MSKIDEIKSCCKDCKDRKYKCHSDCAKYKKFKLVLEQEKKAQLIEKRMNDAHYSVRYGSRKLSTKSKYYRERNSFKK